MADATTGYAPVNGLQMYYEDHGSGGVPLVLLHGAMSGIGTSFGAVLPGLAATRRVLAVEFQAHAHTGDIDRPLTVAALADDVVALLAHLGVERADLFGYSLGAGVAFFVARTRPEVVRKLVLMSLAWSSDGFHPGLMEGMGRLGPEVFEGTPFLEEYRATAPDPDAFPALVEKVGGFNQGFDGWTADDVRAIAAPVLLLVGDSDIVRLEHAVETFELLGGGVAGDLAGLPVSQLAVLPGTTHIGMAGRPEMVLAMVPPFLDAPMPG